MTIIGIDNGLSGGVAVLDYARRFVSLKSFSVMPTVKKNKKNAIDIGKLNGLLDVQDVTDEKYAFVELAHAMPGQGVTSMFNFGMGYGINLALLHAHGFKVEIVSPQKWQKAQFGPDVADTKLTSVNVANLKFGLNLRKAEHGISDAINIALYGLDKILDESNATNP